MQMQELLAQARDVMTVRRVFGEPIEKNGVTIVPVANVMGAAGGGPGPSSSADNTGGGFGLRLTPAGVYVIKDGEVTWRPALNLNLVILGGQLVAMVVFLTIRAIVQARTARRPAGPAAIASVGRDWQKRLPALGR
jgi:uncharacterized spore protein YtfJ